MHQSHKYHMLTTINAPKNAADNSIQLHASSLQTPRR